VVTKSFPANSVLAGVPASVIKVRTAKPTASVASVPLTTAS
jgi:acetyltransferase-like isoleucine patch superfamily enzyme